MYSKIPMPKVDWSKENMRYVLCFFPLIGLVLGAVLYLWGSIAEVLLLSKILRTTIMVLLPLILTGGIHMDGFMDTTDALCSYQPMEKKLEILKDPNVGAFAVIVAICYMLLSFGVWYEVTVIEMPILVMGFVLSRALSGLAVVTFPLAKNSGLAAMFAGEAKRRITRVAMVMVILLCATAMLLINWRFGISALIGALLTFGYYRYKAVKEFGGVTGDLAGYFLQLCELVIAINVILVSHLSEL